MVKRVPNNPSFLNAARFGFRAGGFNNADQRNGRAPRDIAKNNVRRVGRQKAKLCSRAVQAHHFRNNVFSQLV